MPTPPPSRRRALLALLRPDARRWAVLGALLALSSALSLAGPRVVRTIVDRASSDASTAELVRRLALAFLGIAVATQVIAVVVTRWATVTAWGTTNQLRLRITRHVLGVDHEFHRRHTPGELIQRVDGDVTSVSDFLGQVVPKAVGDVLLIARSPPAASTATSAPAAPGSRPARPSCWRWRACGSATPTSSCSTRPLHASTPSPSSGWRPPSPSSSQGARR